MRRLVLLLALALSGAEGLAPVAWAQESPSGPTGADGSGPREVVETWPDGAEKARYALDAEGRRQGPYEERYPGGAVKVKAHYEADLLSGAYTSFFESGRRYVECFYKAGKLHNDYTERNDRSEVVLKARYRDGALDGRLEAFEGKRTVTSQIWLKGELKQLNGVEPYPKPLGAIREKVGAILGPGAPVREPAWYRGEEFDPAKGPPSAKARAPIAERRDMALRRLKAYRCLLGIPYEDMVLDETFNAHCEAGAKLCERIGRLDHTPKNPGLPEDEYKFAYRGTSSSNLSMGPPVEWSVDSYMDDSDPSNIDRIGHRAWCMNPRMLRTGFGESGIFSAMWSMDGSRGKVPDFDLIAYPARGWMPVEFFGDRHAWSVSLNSSHFGPPKKGKVKPRITRLDERYFPVGEPLKLDYLNVKNDSVGPKDLVIFRPEKLEVKPGARYWVELDGVEGRGKKGKSVEVNYLVEFVAVEAPTTGR
ncbi:MAG: hypothetical protein L0216_01815 [Planctomycetales bacterium]|nr:hypothetical protein [Planctomycetales bacterium]